MTEARSSSTERQCFASRLSAALAAAQQPKKATAFARAFNLRSSAAPVTVHGARKWLIGEAFPTQDKIIVLANWLHVDPSWLRFGVVERIDSVIVPEVGAMLSVEMVTLVRDVESLPSVSQVIIREIVDSFIRAAVLGKSK